MKKIQVGPPLSTTNQSEISHIFSLLSVIFFGIMSGYAAITSQELEISIATGLFSLFMFLMSALLISQRSK